MCNIYSKLKYFSLAASFLICWSNNGDGESLAQCDVYVKVGYVRVRVLWWGHCRLQCSGRDSYPLLLTKASLAFEVRQGVNVHLGKLCRHIHIVYGSGDKFIPSNIEITIIFLWPRCNEDVSHFGGVRLSCRYRHHFEYVPTNFSNMNITAFSVKTYSWDAPLPMDSSQGFVSVGYSLYYHFTVLYLTENFTCPQIPSAQPWQCYWCNSLITNTSSPFKYCFNLLSTMRLILEDFPEAVQFTACGIHSLLHLQESSL